MSAHPTAEAATWASDDLVERLERFIKSWEQDEEPRLEPYLPQGPPTHRRFVLVELIKVDLEQRISRGLARRLENYAADFPELVEHGEPPCDLIYEEYHLRRTAGDAITPEEYYQRFPKSAAALRRLMGTQEVSASTQLTAGGRVERFAPGQRLDDFDLLVEVGKGAFASVYLARQISMQRLVALKVSADKGTEPQTLAQLDHPNIIRVFDQRRLADKRVRLMYMQFAPGGTLADVVQQVRQTPPNQRTGALLAAAVTSAVQKCGGLSSDEAGWKRRLAATSWSETVCRLGIQLAYALDYAHKHGILHRDIKPANVLLAADGSPKLADFNISFCSQLDGASPAAYFGGSLAYMSPEQLEACNPQHERKPEDLDGRSDLYALGVMLWELLYGERPFSDEGITGSWLQMLQLTVERRTRDKPRAPPGTYDAMTQRLEHVLRKVLSPRPDERPADGAALARELTLCLNPRAWDLVNDLRTGWRDFARRHPVIALFPVNLPPFLLAGALNLAYNYYFLVTDFAKLPKGPEMITAFWWQTVPVNGLLYPLGTALVLAFAWPVASALRRLEQNEPLSDAELRRARYRAITLGHGVAVVGMALWMVAGIWFPVAIHALTGVCPWDVYAKFLLSMFASGIISFCLPFLATTWLSVRVFFPALLANSTPEPDEQKKLADLARYAGVYFFLSPVAPLVAALLILSSGKPGTERALFFLILGSIAGFAAAYAVWRRIRIDLAALAVVTRPPDLIGTTTDTVEAF